jgi:hypothetical protein
MRGSLLRKKGKDEIKLGTRKRGNVSLMDQPDFLISIYIDFTLPV